MIPCREYVNEDLINVECTIIPFFEINKFLLSEQIHAVLHPLHSLLGLVDRSLELCVNIQYTEGVL